MLTSETTDISYHRLLKRQIRKSLPSDLADDPRMQEFLITVNQAYLEQDQLKVQIMKRGADGKAVIQFGTEVVSSADGSIAGLLGASPGASTAVPIMLDVLAKCFPDRITGWKPRLEKMIPSYGTQLSSNKTTAKKTLAATAKELDLAV